MSTAPGSSSQSPPEDIITTPPFVLNVYEVGKDVMQLPMTWNEKGVGVEGEEGRENQREKRHQRQMLAMLWHYHPPPPPLLPPQLPPPSHVLYKT